jgi:hypothetical protein
VAVSSISQEDDARTTITFAAGVLDALQTGGVAQIIQNRQAGWLYGFHDHVVEREE